MFDIDYCDIFLCFPLNITWKIIHIIMKLYRKRSRNLSLPILFLSSLVFFCNRIYWKKANYQLVNRACNKKSYYRQLLICIQSYNINSNILLYIHLKLVDSFFGLSILFEPNLFEFIIFILCIMYIIVVHIPSRFSVAEL